VKEIRDGQAAAAAAAAFISVNSIISKKNQTSV